MIRCLFSHVRVIALAVALVASANDAALAQQPGVIPEDYQELLKKAQNLSPAAKQNINKVGGSAKTLKAFLNDSTLLSFSHFYGTQIEFAGSDGTTYLWYPGNDILLKGQWKTQPSSEKGQWPEVCVKYAANTFDPGTGKKGWAMAMQ